VTHTKEVLHQLMPKDFAQTADFLANLIDNLVDDGISGVSVEFMFLSDYIATYGIDYYQTSIKAFEKVTRFTSAEFAFSVKNNSKEAKKILNPLVPVFIMLVTIIRNGKEFSAKKFELISIN
jgi:hypothetical protein